MQVQYPHMSKSHDRKMCQLGKFLRRGIRTGTDRTYCSYGNGDTHRRHWADSARHRKELVHHWRETPLKLFKKYNPIKPADE